MAASEAAFVAALAAASVSGPVIVAVGIAVDSVAVADLLVCSDGVVVVGGGAVGVIAEERMAGDVDVAENVAENGAVNDVKEVERGAEVELMNGSVDEQ